jgi:hypothetical protein
VSERDSDDVLEGSFMASSGLLRYEPELKYEGIKGSEVVRARSDRTVFPAEKRDAATYWENAEP